MEHTPALFKTAAKTALADGVLKLAIDRTTGTAQRKRALAMDTRVLRLRRDVLRQISVYL